MNEKESTQEEIVAVYRVDRRGKDREELPFHEILKLARKRGAAAKALWEGPYTGGPRRRRS